jgi:signal transduction histidine kinase
MKVTSLGARHVLIIWLIILLSTGSVIYIGYQRNNKDLRQLMQKEAEQLLNVVNIAAEMSIHSLDVTEQLTADRLLDNARLIELMTRSRIPSKQELKKIAAENKLYMISILDREGKFIVRSEDHIASQKDLLPKHRSEVYDVLAGKYNYRIIGFMDEQYYSGKRYGVVVKGQRVGAVVVNTKPETILDLRKKVGMGVVFKRIGVPENVKYIVLQDTLGIIVSSQVATSMTSIYNDPFLLKAKPGNILSRFLKTEHGDILEVIQPLIIDGYNLGLIRIGLSTDAFNDITDRAKKNLFILFLVTVLLAAFISMYFILRQNYLLLNHEHDRILSDVMKMEEEARRSERLTSMGRLAAGVAHEIRNPLNSINMLVQLLSSEFEVEVNKTQYQNFLSSIKKEIERISIIVDNFLKFSRPPKLKKENISLKSVIEDVAAVVTEKTKKDHLDIKIDVEPTIMCLCDVNQMKQALLNLMLNAMEAIGANGSIRIEAELKDEKILLRISDSGPGIPEDIIGSIFDPYFTTKENGTGLGLSIVHRIVSMHNGSITASNSGNGAAFTIILPKHG